VTRNQFACLCRTVRPELFLDLAAARRAEESNQARRARKKRRKRRLRRLERPRTYTYNSHHQRSNQPHGTAGVDGKSSSGRGRRWGSAAAWRLARCCGGACNRLEAWAWKGLEFLSFLLCGEVSYSEFGAEFTDEYPEIRRLPPNTSEPPPGFLFADFSNLFAVRSLVTDDDNEHDTAAGGAVGRFVERPEFAGAVELSK
jgi:hypothetical protein